MPRLLLKVQWSYILTLFNAVQVSGIGVGL